MIGAGSVVASDIPANVIAAGNPAAVVKPLDPERELVTRASLFHDPTSLAQEMDNIDRYVLVSQFFCRLDQNLLLPKRGN